ncbi:glutamyl-tRNA(Gln) amidotransferase subunit C [Carex rostrata]
MISCGLLPRLRLAASPLKPGLVPTSKRSSYSHRPHCAAALESPDVARLADAARISLSPQEVEQFGPKIRQVVDWFGQLQAVDLESIEPSLRASTEAVSSPREDTPETFDNREAIIEAIPSYDDPYIKVPRVLNKD